MVVSAGRRERSGDAADHNLLASEDVRHGVVLFWSRKRKKKEQGRKQGKQRNSPVFKGEEAGRGRGGASWFAFSVVDELFEILMLDTSTRARYQVLDTSHHR